MSSVDQAWCERCRWHWQYSHLAGSQCSLQGAQLRSTTKPFAQ